MNECEKMTFSKRVTDFIRTYRILFYMNGIQLVSLIAGLFFNVFLIRFSILIQAVLAMRFYKFFKDLFAIQTRKSTFYTSHTMLQLTMAFSYWINSLIFSLITMYISKTHTLLHEYHIRLAAFYFSVIIFNLVVYAIFDRLRQMSSASSSLREAV